MLTTTGLSVRLQGREVVRALSFTARQGTVTGLIGPNGAGKSTLLRALAGLVSHKGRVELDGRPLPAPGSRARARLLGYLPQGHTLHWPLTVRRTVELGRLPHLGRFAGAGAADRAAVARVLSETATDAFADRSMISLSGGERARVMLARVLVADTPVILADEPAAALDPAHQLRILSLLRAMAVERGRAVVVVLHDLSLAARFCDDLVLLADGGVAASGPASAVLVPEVLAPVYGVAFAVGRTEGIPVVFPVS